MSFIKVGQHIYHIVKFIAYGFTAKVKRLEDKEVNRYAEKVTRGNYQSVFQFGDDFLLVYEHEKDTLKALGLLKGYLEPCRKLRN